MIQLRQLLFLGLVACVCCCNPQPDYTLVKYGQRFSSDRFRLRVTMERVTPYTPNAHYYEVYTGEGLDLPLYKIALVRPLGQWSKFVFLVYRCATNKDMMYFGKILNSVRAVDSFGRSKSFREHYSPLHYKSAEVFGQMPWIISEFGCGAGGAASGEEKRNASRQAGWVRSMFDDFLNRSSFPYLQPIKGAVWFSANDYSGNQTSNYYELSADLVETLQAFHDGFEAMYPNE